MSLTLRGIKGSALTHGELDNNFIWLSGRDIVAAVIDGNSNLILTKEDSSYYSVPLSGVGATISGLTFSGNVLTITQSDGSSLSVNISSVDIRVTDLVYSANTLTLYQSDGSNETVLIPQFSGGTISGPTNFSNGLSANTFNTTSLTLNGVTITGFTNYVFTGNTSGDCITDLYVTNLNSCSPLHIQPTNSGDVYIGENGGVNVGIGTSTPTQKLDVRGNGLFSGGVTTLLNIKSGGGSSEGKVLLENSDNNNSIDINCNSNYAWIDMKSIAGGYFSIKDGSNNKLRLGFDSNGEYLRFKDYFFISNEDNTKPYGVITTLGNVGIGSPFYPYSPFGEPTSKLHVVGSDSSSGFGLKVQNSGETNTLQVRNDGLVEFGDTSQLSNTWLQYTGGTLKLNYNTTSNFYWDGSQLQLTGLNGNGSSKLDFTSIAARKQTLIRSYNDEKLSFGTNGSNANMQLSSNGDLFIGEDTSTGVTASARLEIRGSGTTSSGYGLKVQDSNGTNNFVVRNDGFTRIGVENGVRAEFDISGNGYYKFMGGNGNWGVRINPLDVSIGAPTISSPVNGISIGSKLWIEQDPQFISRNVNFHWDLFNDTYSSWNVREYITQQDLFTVRAGGNVGIGVSIPTAKLDVSGKTKTTNFQMTSGATTAGYVLTDSDGNGNAQWSPASGITGVGNVFKYTITTGFTASVTQTITHNLNTKFVHCSVWDSSTDQLISAQVVRNSGDINNAVDITISTTGTYDILITG